MLRTALNAVSEEWEIFVQIILRRVTLLGWEEMWATLHHEEIRWLTKVGSSGKGIRIKKEEEDAALSFAE